MKTEQTAVEWLVNEMPVIDWQHPYWKIKLEKAKEMEKEQMCKFAYKCHNHYKVNGDFKIEQYYNETFKSE